MNKFQIPDPGNPPQTFAFQYEGITFLDGTTPGRRFSTDETSDLYIAPSLDGIYRIDQNGPLGLIDPDGGHVEDGGSVGDRFILWMAIFVDSPTSVGVTIVDAESGDILQTIQASTPVNEVMYLSTHFRVPQGGLIGIRSTTQVGARVRVRSALFPDDCCDGDGDGDGNGVVATALEHASIGFGDEDAGPFVQTGAGDDWVNVVGAAVLESSLGFVAGPVPNSVQYAGASPATFLVSATMNISNPQAEGATMAMRLAVNGVAVARSTTSTVQEDGGWNLAMTTGQQVRLSPGDFVTTQVHSINPDAPLDPSSQSWRMQLWRVGT
jgi:hypothetical protein